MRRSPLLLLTVAAALAAAAIAPTADATSRHPSLQSRPAAGAHRQYLLTAPGGRKGDLFGSTVAIGGGLIAVGAPYRTVNGHKDQGAVYLFQKPASGWGHATVTAILTVAGGHAGDFFGASVAVAHNTVVVGTPLITVGTNTHEGQVYLFSKPANGWSAAHHPTGRLFPSDRTANDLFGASLAAAGNTIVVGAPGHVVGQHARQGAAYVFLRPRGGWLPHNRQTRELTASNGRSGNELGYSVAISGHTVAAGAPYTQIGQHPSQGATYVFTKPSSGWATATDRAELTVRGGATGDYFGYGVAVTGGTIAASAPFRKVGTTARQGAAYVFVKPGSGWRSAHQSATLTVSPGVTKAYFGTGLAAGGTRIVGTGYGLASLFVEPSTGWHGVRHQQAQLAGATNTDFIGREVAISGSTIVAGAPTQTVGRHVGQGAVYVYVR